MPRVRTYPFSSDRFDARSGQVDLLRGDGRSGDSPADVDGIRRQPQEHPVIANGSNHPTSFIESLMQAAPHQEPQRASEEVLVLAELLTDAMWAALDERERFVIDALFFEQLSLRELGRRMSLSKSQVHRIRDGALVKLRTHLSQVGEAPSTIDS